MLNIQTNPPKQVLLRLPEDVAIKLARAVPARQRNQFLVALLRQELEKEDAELVAACEALNAVEAAHPEIVLKTQHWLDADLTDSVGAMDSNFDQAAFEREFTIAQAKLQASRPTTKPIK